MADQQELTAVAHAQCTVTHSVLALQVLRALLCTGLRSIQEHSPSCSEFSLICRNLFSNNAFGGSTGYSLVRTYLYIISVLRNWGR